MKVYTVIFKSKYFGETFSRVFSTEKKADEFIQEHALKNKIKLCSTMYEITPDDVEPCWIDYRAEAKDGNGNNYFYVIQSMIIDEPAKRIGLKELLN